MCSSPEDKQGHERNYMSYGCPRGHDPRQASARTCCESPRPRATQRHEGDDEETNPAITTGNGALYGRKQDQRLSPQVLYSNLYGSRQAMLHHVHSGTAGIDGPAERWIQLSPQGQRPIWEEAGPGAITTVSIIATYMGAGRRCYTMYTAVQRA